MEINDANMRILLKSAQRTYAEALAEFNLCAETAADLKEARGVVYTDDMDDDATAAMCDVEGAIDDSVGLGAARAALTAAEQSLVAWGIGIACSLVPQPGVLRELEQRARTSAIARAKVAAICYRLAV
jgi:hypothetical protein